MKLYKKPKSCSVLLISCILIFLVSSLNISNPSLRFNQREDESLDISNSSEIFDGMYINYTITILEETKPSQFRYTNISDNEFHVDWFMNESGYISHMYWDVDAQTRVIENSGGAGWQFGNGYHTPIWIITEVSIGDQIPIVVDGEGDHLFEVTSELIFEIPGIGPTEAWILEDLNVSGGVAWYEKSTGILLNGLFYYDEGNHLCTFEFVDTNAEFNFTRDYELGVSLEVPTFCEIGVTLQINATVTNYGVEDVVNINVSLYLDGYTIKSFLISNLASRSSKTNSYYWTPIEYGVYNFTAYTPPLPDELFLDNNYASEIIPLHRIHLFDGMYIDYDFTYGAAKPSQFNYSYISGNKFHVDWFMDESGSISHMYWDENAQTRVIENSGGDGWQFGNGYHTPIWIITDVSIGDQIHIFVYGEGDHLFEVTSELIYIIPGIGPVEVWILEDLNVSGGVAWYEKSTGILLNGLFYILGGSYNYEFEFVNTNAEFNFTHDFELGVSLKILKVPIISGIGTKLQINITITNYGLKTIYNINISLYMDGQTLNSFILSNLPSGSDETITDYWTPIDYGVYNFTVYVSSFQEEPYLDNNYATKIIHLPPTRLFDGMYIKGHIEVPETLISNVSYTYHSDNLFDVSWNYNVVQWDYWKVNLTTREIRGSNIFNQFTHTPFWIFIDVSIGDRVLISAPLGSDQEYEVSDELIYKLPGYGPVDVWVLQDIHHPDGIVWYEKSTGILLNGTLFTGVAVYYTFDFTASNAKFSYVYPPNSFELTTDAALPSDSDGKFKLMWTVAEGALAYTVYQYSSRITEINETLTILIENTTDLQLNLDGYSDGTYYFIVVAYNNYGERKSNCIEVNIEILQAPEPFDLNTDAESPSDSDGEFNLFWTESINANNYSVYQYSSRIIEINETLTILIENTTDLQLNLDDYSDGTYYFIVVAYNNYGERKSNCIEVNIKILQAPEPFNLNTDAESPSDSDGEFNLFWTESINANNYSVYQYSSRITEINASLTLLSDEITVREFLISDYNNGEFYFIVIARNNEGIILSNCIKVNVVISTRSSPTSILGYPLYFIGIIFMVVILFLYNRKFRVKQIT